MRELNREFILVQLTMAWKLPNCAERRKPSAILTFRTPEAALNVEWRLISSIELLLPGFAEKL